MPQTVDDLTSRARQAETGHLTELGKVLEALIKRDVASGNAAVSDISDSATGAEIATAVNGILAALRADNAIST